MTKILFIRASLEEIGGVEMQVMHIARYLRENTSHLALLATDRIDSHFARRFAEECGEVVFAPIGRNDYKQKEALAMLKAHIERNGITIIQSHLFRESIIARRLKRICPGLIHIFRVETYINVSWIPYWRKLLYHLLEKFTSDGVDHYIANGNIVAKELEKESFISSEKITVIFDGSEKLGPDTEKRSSTEGALPRRVAMVANILPRKGHDTLIRCLSILNKKGIHVNVRLIGGELSTPGYSHKYELMKMAEEYKVQSNLEFYGFSSNMQKALESYDIVVLPSDSEGTPNCILEAMSTRRLVIASSVGSVPFMLTNNVEGLLHKAGDAEEMARLLENVFNTPAVHWEHMRDKALKKWESNFSIEIMMKKLIEVYNKYGS